MFQSICYGVLATITMNSCTVASKQQQRGTTVEKLNLNSTGAAINKIAFLTFRITATDTLKDLFDIKLINTHFAEGLLKKNVVATETVIEPYYLYYQVYREDKKRQDKHFERVINPLSKVLEYSSEDGKLAKKTVYNNSGELVIRFQYDQNLKSLKIFKPDQRSLALKPIYHAIL